MQYINKDYFHEVNKIKTQAGSLDTDFGRSSQTNWIFLFSLEVNAGYHNCGLR